MMNTDGTVPGNLPNVSKAYCACRATQALNAGSRTWALPRDMRRVAGVPVIEKCHPVVPPMAPRTSIHPQFAERNQLMPGPEGQRAARDSPPRAKRRERRPNSASTSGNSSSFRSTRIPVPAC
jgi:hypothetical protein